MNVTMDKIHEMVDANTIIGTPIQTGDVTLIPVSRLSFGIASGGSDFTTKIRSRSGQQFRRRQRGQRQAGAGGLPHHPGGERQAAAGGASSGNHGGPGHRGGPRGGGQGDGVWEKQQEKKGQPDPDVVE